MRRSALLVAIGLLAAGTFVVASPAAASSGWIDGNTSQNTKNVNCASQIQGNPYDETTVSTFVGWYSAGRAPQVGEVFYARMVWGTSGNSCASTTVDPQIYLPPGVALAVSAANPLYCYASVDGTTADWSSSCQVAVGDWGTSNWYRFYRSGQQSSVFPSAQRTIWELRFPIVADRTMSGGASNLIGALRACCDKQQFDGPTQINNGVPDMGPYVGLVVTARPAASLSYPSPATTSVTPTTARMNAHVVTAGRSGTVSIEYGATTAYGATDTGDLDPAWDAADVWTDASGLTPNTMYHWRAVLRPTGESPIVGADQTFTTPKQPSTTSVTMSPSPSTEGQLVTITATVGPNGLPPAGTVTFLDGTTTLGTVQVDMANQGVFSTSALAVGSHTITANYSGSSVYTSSSGSVQHTVGARPIVATTTALSATPSPSDAGQAVTFTATVTPASGTAVPSGTVTFREGTTTLGSSALDGSGRASFSTDQLAIGTHIIDADYGGAPGFAPSSGGWGHAVREAAKVDTSIGLGASANPSRAGMPVTFTAQVVQGSGSTTPTGSVTFKDGDAVLATLTLNASGVAAHTTSSLAWGSHAIAAVYDPTGNFNGSAVTLTQDVERAPMTITATATPDTVDVNQPVRIDAQISPVPTSGQLVFNGDGCGPFLVFVTPDAEGKASTNVTPCLRGQQSTLVSFFGNDTQAPASAAAQFTVTRAQSTTAVTADPSPSASGESVLLHALVTSSVPEDPQYQPRGTVTFKDGSTVLGTAPIYYEEGVVRPEGHANFATDELGRGDHVITAEYSGDTTLLPSSGTANHTVVLFVQVGTTTTLTAAPTPSIGGDPITLRTTVMPASGTVSPTGTVTFKDGDTTLGTATLSAAREAAFVVANASVGSHAFTAEYSGDARFIASAGGATHSVQAAPTGAYIQMAPRRILDTRPGELDSDGFNVKVGPNFVIDVPVAGPGRSVPTGAKAAVINLTAVNSTEGGYVMLYPTGARPASDTSNLNFTAGQPPVPNLVIAPIGADGKVSVFNKRGEVDVIFDVMGYFPADSTYTPLTPIRILDTRPGELDGDGFNVKVGPEQALDVPVAGPGRSVPTGAKAAVINVTSVNSTGGGYLMLYPTGARPASDTSNLNFTAGQPPVPNLVIAPIGADGKVSVFNKRGEVDVIFDVMGYFP